MSVLSGNGPHDDANTALEIDDLTVAYNSKPAIWDIDLRVPEGVLMAVIGPNGAGKSTLIKAALKLIPRAAGTPSAAASTGTSPPPSSTSSPWASTAVSAGSAVPD